MIEQIRLIIKLNLTFRATHSDNVLGHSYHTLMKKASPDTFSSIGALTATLPPLAAKSQENSGKPFGIDLVQILSRNVLPFESVTSK